MMLKKPLYWTIIFFSSCFNNAQPPLDMVDYNALAIAIYIWPNPMHALSRCLCAPKMTFWKCCLLWVYTTKLSGPDGILSIALSVTVVQCPLHCVAFFDWTTFTYFGKGRRQYCVASIQKQHCINFATSHPDTLPLFARLIKIELGTVYFPPIT